MASPSPLSEANTNFCLDLFKKLSDNDNTQNIFYSPFSISSALAMVMLGTRGNTATQISEVLHFTEAPTQEKKKDMMQQRVQSSLPQRCLKTQDVKDDVHTSFAPLLNKLNKKNAPCDLSVANRLYGEQTYGFIEDFLGDTKKYYKAELEPVDFIESSEAARLNINNWVESQTQDKIQDLLAEGVVDSMTRLVLVNAIYFKGNWNKKFMEDSTKDASFRINKSETKPVKMMRQKTKFHLTYIPEADCQILEMPYIGEEISMLIFLPTDIKDSTTGLEQLEKMLTYKSFIEWTLVVDPTSPSEVHVELPRFKMTETYDLKNVLISMGMVDAFNTGLSDFSGMSPANDLVLSKVVHKAFVEVNEKGTEAAAATAANIMLRSVHHPKCFIADHPFLFFIRHNPSMSILFAGRYCSPE